jgi:fucokinase
MNLNKLPTLAEQLMLRIGSGLEIESWSILPVGSGMGGSSILGAALLYCLGRCSGMGVHTTAKCLIHDVIRLEKLSNDDCGWQDQAGGAVPGAKCISSPNSLPLDARLEQYRLDQPTLKSLEQRIVLVRSAVEF